MKKLTTVILLILLFAGCSLSPDSSADISDGIVIYSGREILNDREIEIVINRVQRLYATSPAGHLIEWSSSNPSDVDIDEYGVIRTSRSPNKEAVITAVSVMDPALKAQVIFRTKGLR